MEFKNFTDEELKKFSYLLTAIRREVDNELYERLDS